jgi:hypothetical protein
MLLSLALALPLAGLVAAIPSDPAQCPTLPGFNQTRTYNGPVGLAECQKPKVRLESEVVRGALTDRLDFSPSPKATSSMAALLARCTSARPTRRRRSAASATPSQPCQSEALSRSAHLVRLFMCTTSTVS